MKKVSASFKKTVVVHNHNQSIKLHNLIGGSALPNYNEIFESKELNNSHDKIKTILEIPNAIVFNV